MNYSVLGHFLWRRVDANILKMGPQSVIHALDSSLEVCTVMIIGYCAAIFFLLPYPCSVTQPLFPSNLMDGSLTELWASGLHLWTLAAGLAFHHTSLYLPFLMGERLCWWFVLFIFYPKTTTAVTAVFTRWPASVMEAVSILSKCTQHNCFATCWTDLSLLKM